MTMKALHTTTALIEGGTGLALLAMPSLVVTLLLGSPLDSPVAVTLGRVAGIALFVLGTASWFARDDSSGRAAHGLVAAMSVYNGAVAIVLAYSGIASGLVGPALWPAVGLHVGMTLWCVIALKRKAPADQTT